MPIRKTRFPVPLEILSGHLPAKNVSLSEALNFLDIKQGEYEPPEVKMREILEGTPSYYYEKFMEGATIVPRYFWLVKVVKHGIFMVNPDSPYVVTDEDNEAKAPWKEVRLSGRVDSPFLYATMLSTDLIPFGYVRVRPVVLPVFVKAGKFQLIESYKSVVSKYPSAGEYFAKAEKIWSEKAVKDTEGELKISTPYKRLDYPQRNLTQQDPLARYKVLYVASSTYLAACTIEQTDFAVNIDGAKVKLGPFVAESKTYWYETSSEDEADYLAAILNSAVVDEFIKPLQTRGLWGARDIHKRPLLLPIPKFDESDSSHVKLAELGRTCRKLVLKEASRLAGYNSIGRARSEIRDNLSDELGEINELTTKVLSKTSKSGDLSRFLKG